MAKEQEKSESGDGTRPAGQPTPDNPASTLPALVSVTAADAKAKPLTIGANPMVAEVIVNAVGAAPAATANPKVTKGSLSPDIDR